MVETDYYLVCIIEYNEKSVNDIINMTVSNL